MVEILLRNKLDGHVFEVASAGVWGWDGAPVDGMVQLELARLGARADHFASRAIDDSMIKSADLILTATRDHRAFVVDRHPEALARTFTVREFAQLAPAVEADSLQTLVAAASVGRSGTQNDIDLDDPYRQPPDVHRAVAEQVSAATSVIAWQLAKASTGKARTDAAE